MSDEIQTDHGTLRWLTGAEAARSFAADSVRSFDGPPIGRIGGGRSWAGGTAAGGSDSGGADPSGRDPAPRLVVELVNLGAATVVPYRTTAAGVEIARVAEPLLPGGVTGYALDCRRVEGSGGLEVDLLLATARGSVEARVGLAYVREDGAGRWRIELGIDGQTHRFDESLELVAGVFSGLGDTPSFGIYTAGIGTLGGEVTVTLVGRTSRSKANVGL